jgi:PAS domain S-box-containing protein
MNAKLIRVLVVEDNEPEAVLLRDWLRQQTVATFSLDWAPRLSKAIEATAKNDYDVVLLDLTLPDAQGLDCFATFHKYAPYLPVVVLSGQDDEEMAMQTVHLGAQDYLVKGGFEVSSLVRAMWYAMERHRTEQELTRERNALRTIIDSLPDSIFMKDIEGRYLMSNEAHRHSLGLGSEEEVLGKTVYDLFPAELAEKYAQADREIIHTGHSIVNRREPWVSRTGQTRWVLTTKVPLRGPDNKVTSLVCISRDITDDLMHEEELNRANADLARSQGELLKALSDLQRSHQQLRDTRMQLIQAEKMESIGRLAAGVAHEVKNPLAIILMGVDYLCQCQSADDAQTGQVLRDIREAILRADRVISGLLDFSAPRELQLAAHNLNEIIEQSLIYVKHELAVHHVVVATDLQKDLPLLRLDHNKIKQVLINLFTNAIGAMAEGGSLFIRTLASHHHAEVPGENPAEHAFTSVILEIEDTGCGIPPDKLDRVFDPFYTTKPLGQGTGLGLTVTRQIVELHHGRLELANRPEGGCRVTVVFNVEGT